MHRPRPEMRRLSRGGIVPVAGKSEEETGMNQSFWFFLLIPQKSGDSNRRDSNLFLISIGVVRAGYSPHFLLS